MDTQGAPIKTDGNLEGLDQSDLSKNVQSYLATLDKNGESRLPQRAYLATRHAIRHLQLPPGQTILEREMAEILDMSRTPVRELYDGIFIYCPSIWY